MHRSQLLVVDDRADQRELLAEALAPEGYSLRAARDGLEAMGWALGTPPDLVIADVDMPGLGGIDLCRRLKEDPRTRRVPVILVTGGTTREDRVRGMEAGCDDFLAKPFDVDELRARVRGGLRTKHALDQLEDAEDVLVSLARAIDAKDPYTAGHGDRVGLLARALGRCAGLEDEELELLQRAGRVHDVGKIGTPRELLSKPGVLTAAERAVVQLHPVVGATICQPLRSLAPLVPLVRGHHEALDGSGYPDGLSGREIPITFRCLTVADVWDALVTSRPYRPAMEPEDALAVLWEGALRGRWDRDIVELLPSALATLAGEEGRAA